TVVVLQAHYVLFVEIAEGHFHEYAPFFGFEAMMCARRHKESLAYVERDTHMLAVGFDGRCRVTLYERPELRTVIVILQRKSFARLYVDGLQIPLRTLIPSVEFSPGSHAPQETAAHIADHPRGRLYFT